jgi:hypothetical protein
MATETYQKEAIKYPQMTNYILRRKLTALILSGCKIKTFPDHKAIYQYGCMNLLVDEDKHGIEMIY